MTAALYADTQPATSPGDLADKTIEELMNVDVTSVSRKEQKLSKTPAAVYVITQEQIERSGATVLPDLLRMAPGVQVAQVEANRWAISIRGFNDIFSNKVLVLVDGRTVYTPTFSGVYWDQLDIPLNDIERIEVVRGPGGTVWGANAVDGVISIVTKSSAETKGALVNVGAGSTQTADYLAQYGGSLAGSVTYRAFAHYASFADRQSPDGINAHDGWLIRHAGFRADWKKSDKDSFMAEGNIFQTNGGQDHFLQLPGQSPSMLSNLTNSGGDVLALWNHKHSDRSESTLQVYDNYYSRFDTGLNESLNTIDIDYKNHTAVGARNDAVWGLGYRYTSDQLGAPPNSDISPFIGFGVAFQPRAKGYSLFNAFLQDEIRVAENLSVTVGSKLEHNAFTGFEYEPSARLAWTPTDSQTVWLAASRAIVQPSRMETALDVALPSYPVGPGLFLTSKVLGDPHFKAELLNDYEAGYRVSPTSRLMLDLTGFYSFYNNLERIVLAPPTFSTGSDGLTMAIPLVYGNLSKAQNYGAETAATWSVAPRWKLSGSFSWLRMNVYDIVSNSGMGSAAAAEGWYSQTLGVVLVQQLLKALGPITDNNNAVRGTSPRYQTAFQSYSDITHKISFDNSLYFVSSLPALNVPAYTRLDSRVGWKLHKNVAISLVGQNLLNSHHLEFGNVEQAVATEVDRSIFGKVVWSF